MIALLSPGVIVRSGYKLTPDVLKDQKRLKAVVRAGVGVDNIDLPAATREGIVVMNTPAGNTTSTAEHAFAMMMALSRNIAPACAALKGGKWDRKSYTGTQLAGKTLGVVGLGRASEILYTGDLVGSEEALRIGLVNRVVPDGDALKESMALARKLSQGPAFAHAMTKQMIEDEHDMSLDEAIEAEAQAQAICMMHPDFKEAYDAIKAKRPPRFQGAPES